MQAVTGVRATQIDHRHTRDAGGSPVRARCRRASNAINEVTAAILSKTCRNIKIDAIFAPISQKISLFPRFHEIRRNFFFYFGQIFRLRTNSGSFFAYSGGRRANPLADAANSSDSASPIKHPVQASASRIRRTHRLTHPPHASAAHIGSRIRLMHPPHTSAHASASRILLKHPGHASGHSGSTTCAGIGISSMP